MERGLWLGAALCDSRVQFWEAIRQRYPNGLRDIVGGATADGLPRYRGTGDPRTSGAGIGRAGNGSLMRCLATAFAAADQPTRIRESMEVSAITHDDPRCTVACAAYNEVAAA